MSWVIMIIALAVLIIGPVSAVGVDSVAKPQHPLVQRHEPSEQASASTPGEPSSEREKAGVERQRSWLARHVTFIGDLRAAVPYNRRGKRDGDAFVKVIPAVRLRGGAAVSIFPWLGVTARLALGIDTEIEGFDFQFKFDGGLEPGDVTFDELFLTLKPHELFTIEGGRLQTAFEVDSAVKDSLSRNDSSGLDITWTDGFHVIIGRPSAFTLHLIGQANPEDGPTNGVGARGPVDFEDGASRFTYYAALEAPSSEPFTQLLADVTIIPQALRPEGLGSEVKESVVAFTMKGAADFPLSWLEPIVLHPFWEFGVMAWTPQENVLEVSNSTESAGRFAVVAGLDLKNLGPGTLGFQFNWTQPGYLVSPDYPNNTWSAEIRYKVGIFKKAVFEIRYRHRQEIDKLVGAQERQTDDNVQARITVKF
ncbi:MAG: hypothetical protein ACE5G5_11765 [Candidatus Methylomirabilales bacterium]